MSADNGIYILQTRDQYRVIYAHAIDNLWWTFIEFKNSNEPVSTRLVEYFGNIRYTKIEEVAQRVAFAKSKDYPVLEYGISTIKVNKTWKQIKYEARRLAVKEIESIKATNSGDFWKAELTMLEKLIS